MYHSLVVLLITNMGIKKSKLSSQYVDELAAQSNCSRAEVKKFYSNFRKNQPDGRLTKDQFKELYKRFFPDGDASSFSELSFKLEVFKI